MSDTLQKLKNFVENGGRFRKGEEPQFGEPFYGDYLKQYLPLYYHPGDKVRIQLKINDYEKICEGIIIELGYFIQILTCGKKVHKNRQNKCAIAYSHIYSIEMLQPSDGTFNLAIVDPSSIRKSLESDYKTDYDDIQNRHRLLDKEQFSQVYPNVDFERSHVIKISGGCNIYWPFMSKNISADIYLVREEDIIRKFSCNVKRCYPNKDYIQAFNQKTNDHYPNLFLYLPDNGFRYKDINIVCVWTIEMTISGEDCVIKVVNMHQLGEIKPIKEELNMILLEMKVYPLLGYGDAIFTEPELQSLLSNMMNEDIYCTIFPRSEKAVTIKTPYEISSEELDKHLRTALYSIYDFDSENLLKNGLEETESLCPLEVFCNIDKDIERYFSSAMQKLRAEYKFKPLLAASEDNSTIQ